MAQSANLCGLQGHMLSRKPALKQSDQRAGRRDAAAAGPADRLPAETMDAATQRAAFAAKAFSCQEMVALLGAHTVRSSTFLNCAEVQTQQSARAWLSGEACVVC
jgi:Peroxidase